MDPSIKKPIFGLIDNQNMNNDYGLSVLEYILRQFHDAQTGIFFNLLPNILLNSIYTPNYQLALWILMNAPKEAAKTLITEEKGKKAYEYTKNRYKDTEMDYNKTLKDINQQISWGRQFYDNDLEILELREAERNIKELNILIQKMYEILAQP